MTSEVLLIGGDAVAAAHGAVFESFDPSTGMTLAQLSRGGKPDVDAAVVAAREALPGWRATRPVDRARLLLKIGRAISAHRDELARTESMDTGKPLKQARADVDVSARYFEFYAGLADKIMGTTIPLGDAYLDLTMREPIGVSGQIIPWNYPLQIGARGIAPALAAGCTIVVKPAEEASLSLLRLGRIAAECGLPSGVLNIVTGIGSEAGAALASNAGVDQITFTGSVETGTLVMQAAATNIVPVTLELGGKSPNVVFADADLDAVLPVILNAIVQNAGQTCSAGTRLIVEAGVHERLIEQIAARMASLRLAPGVDDPDMGPLISPVQLDRVASYVDLARAEGIDVRFGGRRAAAAEEFGGFFFEPTLLDNVSPSSRLAREEVFGPVLAVLPFTDEHEAIALANNTEYGLNCGVWTRDVSRAVRAARAIEAGQIYVNGFGAAGGVELPFGGYKKSGFGREKGVEGLNSYLQTKNVCICL